MVKYMIFIAYINRGLIIPCHLRKIKFHQHFYHYLSLGCEDLQRREWLPTPVFWPGRVEHDWASFTFMFDDKITSAYFFNLIFFDTTLV